MVWLMVVPSFERNTFNLLLILFFSIMFIFSTLPALRIAFVSVSFSHKLLNISVFIILPNKLYAAAGAFLDEG